MRRMNRRTGRRAFSLIELLIVIAILLAIGGLVVVNLLPAREQADANLTRVQIAELERAIEFFQMDMKRFPTEDEGLRALWTKDAIEDEEDAENWSRAYLKDPVPEDPWGNEWIYRYPGEIRGEQYYDIISVGPDGEEGTEDDITNHDDMVDEEGEMREEFTDFGGDEGDLGP